MAAFAICNVILSKRDTGGTFKTLLKPMFLERLVKLILTFLIFAPLPYRKFVHLFEVVLHTHADTANIALNYLPYIKSRVKKIKLKTHFNVNCILKSTIVK
jgi:hypothetical protein